MKDHLLIDLLALGLVHQYHREAGNKANRSRFAAELHRISVTGSMPDLSGQWTDGATAEACRLALQLVRVA